jgi:hypothetical protein
VPQRDAVIGVIGIAHTFMIWIFSEPTLDSNDVNRDFTRSVVHKALGHSLCFGNKKSAKLYFLYISTILKVLYLSVHCKSSESEI